MTDLTRTWPPGLRHQNLLQFAFGFVLLIGLLYFIDRPISEWGAALTGDARAVFRWITRWGQSDWVLIPTLVAWLVAWLLSFVTRDRLKAALNELAALSGFVFLGVGLPGLASALLKRAIGRGRPETWTVETPLSFQSMNLGAYHYQSFPSGHATTSFALAAVVAFVWPRLFWPALMFAATISLSRVVLGEHYPTDITAGAVLGVLGAYGVRALFASKGWLFTPAEGRIVRQPLVAIPALFRR